MPNLTVRDPRLGTAAFDIAFVRTGETTHFEVTKGPADRLARRSMRAWSEALTGQRSG